MLAGVAEGKAQAIEALIEQFVRPVTLFAEQIVGDRDDAEDIAEETFLIVIRQAGQFTAARGDFRNWLYAIARGVARRHNERKRRRKRLWERWGGAVRSDPGPAAATEARETLARVARILDELPEMQRQCFELHVVRGLDVEEVAAMFDVSASTVRQHVFRARKVIRARLREVEDS